jgi:hypothetical protein
MKRHLLIIGSLLTAVLTFTALPGGAFPQGDATGSVTPDTVAAGGTLTVNFEAGPGTGQCDDYGSENDEYANRPLVFGLFPATTALDPDVNVPSAWYNDGTPLDELGFVVSPGILATSPAGQASGWEGSFTGQVTLPDDLTAGDYVAVWSCGQPDTLEYDSNGRAVSQSVTVTGTTPGPQPGNDGISLTLAFSVGDSIRTGTAGVPVSGAGLKPGADYTVVLRSDPVEIGAGVNDANGAFSATYPIPGDTPAGPHSVTVTSLNTADEEVSAVAWFTLDANGIVTAISYDGPTAAAASPRFTG